MNVNKVSKSKIKVNTINVNKVIVKEKIEKQRERERFFYLQGEVGTRDGTWSVYIIEGI